MSASDAAEALERLGLSSYEAKIFVALQQLGTGDAQEIARESGVPRSQVYGVADELGERGLVEQIESSPKRFRPVSLDAAREQLTDRLERERARAFENLEAISGDHENRPAGTEVATLRGHHPIEERVGSLLSTAESRIMYVAPSADQVSETVAAVLRDRAAAGVDVMLATEDETVADRFEDEPIFVFVMTGEEMPGYTGRTLLVDEATVLLSVIPEESTETTDELALWTADTSIGTILAQFISNGMERGMGK